MSTAATLLLGPCSHMAMRMGTMHWLLQALGSSSPLPPLMSTIQEEEGAWHDTEEELALLVAEVTESIWGELLSEAAQELIALDS